MKDKLEPVFALSLPTGIKCRLTTPGRLALELKLALELI
jgi:hypothetical protein